MHRNQHASQADQTEPLELRVEAHAFRRSPRSLTAPQGRFLLGFQAQIRPKRREFWRHRRLFRPRNRFQSALSFSDRIAFFAGFLRSTGISRFIATMNPSDSHPKPLNSYLFLPRVEVNGLASAGLPGSQSSLSTRAVPSYPGKPDGFAHLLTSSTGDRLHHDPAGWPASIGVTRPDRVRLRYGSRLRRAGLRVRDCSAPAPAWLPVEQVIRWITSFQVIRDARLSWRTGLHGLRGLRPQLFLLERRCCRIVVRMGTVTATGGFEAFGL